MPEVFDVVDEDDNVIGRATRKECHTDNKLIHRAVQVFVFNSKGELLLEKRSMAKDLCPGKMGSVAGHLKSGENYEDAAKRELKEELGIEAELEHVCDVKKRVKEESENIKLFICRHNGPFSVDKNEAEFVKFFPINWIKNEIEKNYSNFAPGTVLCFEKFLEIKNLEIKLLIFDVGGVLRDSRKAINEGFRRGFASCGLKYGFTDDDAYHLRGIGKYNRSRVAVRALLAFSRANVNADEIIERKDAESVIDGIVNKNITASDSALIDKIYNTYEEFFYSDDGGRLVSLRGGVKPALEKLARKYKLAIFTNAKVSSVKRDLGALVEMFSAIVSEENIAQKKPSGEGIVKVCEKAGILPGNAAYVGDSVVDILAARDAHCLSIAVLGGMGIEKHLRNAKPDFIFKDLGDMVLRLG